MDASQALLLGRRCLEEIEEFDLIDDLTWCDEIHSWILKFRITFSPPVDSSIPPISFWYMHISNYYPRGDISIFPATEGGISSTYEHQLNNAINERYPWRNGKVCVQSSLISFRRKGYDIEPYNSTDRLVWHIKRCICWLELASKNKLSSVGDPFELPHYPEPIEKTIIFSEDDDTFKIWNEKRDTFGFVKLAPLLSNFNHLIITSFLDIEENTLNIIRWSDSIATNSRNAVFGFWIALNKVPAKPPWQAPITWEDLYAIALDQGVDFQSIFKNLYFKK